MAADLPVPIFTKLEEAHPDPVIATRESGRWNELANAFQSRFGHPPTYIARAPGRVNIIGEHIDYALFGVFPAAVDQDILIACGPSTSTGAHDAYTRTSGQVRAHNLHPKYGSQTFAPVLKTENGKDAWYLEIDKTQLRWESYVKAGYYGVLNRFFDPTNKSEQAPVPVDLLFTGTVPAGSGLSSSAAMVVASTLAFLACNNKLVGIKKGELVELAVENERRVGVNSGGMDQAASVISLPLSALFINFFPLLNAEPIPLPFARTARRGAFVVANSLVVADKVVSAKWHYNLRVVETLVGARILAHLLAPAHPALVGLLKDVERPTFREVLGAYLGVRETKGKADNALTVEQLKAGLEKLLVETEKLQGPALRGEKAGELGLTMDEMVKFSGLSQPEFHRIYLSWVDVEAKYFEIYRRAKHVFSEALRVISYRDVCLRVAGSDPLPESVLTELGALMNASQDSCNKLFDCSCPELNSLTQICRDAGAYGSRLTGAGWGGCTISLVPEDDVENFIKKVKAAYPPFRDLEGEKLHEAIFATRPASGAFVFKLEA
ncbi:hypothetical protein EIP86_004874 [Pleurotus ostreatoroseus]|nr:hypothetical protein EIP86_004874 [Pleurotus ostreatoroseus]